MKSSELSVIGRQHRLGADALMAVAILGLGAFLAWSGAGLGRRLQASAARGQSLSFEDHLGVAANTTGLIIVVWWALTFAIAMVAALLERQGSSGAAAVAGKFSPAFMRRLALAAVGLQLVTAPLAHAGTGPAAPEVAPPPAISAAWLPTGEVPSPPPTVPGTVPPALGLDPHWTPAPPAVDPGPLAPRQFRSPAESQASITVRAGDSLWSICAAELGPLASDLDIALAWPRLYQANRAVIGTDPGLLLPGQVLRLPVTP